MGGASAVRGAEGHVTSRRVRVTFLTAIAVFLAFLAHPLVGGLVSGAAAGLIQSLGRSARIVFGVLAVLLLVYGAFFSLVPFWLT